MSTGYKLDGTLAAETLNGEGPTVDTENMKATDFDRQFSARQVIDDYEDNDMPLGWFLPNDGYGARLWPERLLQDRRRQLRRSELGRPS